MRVMKVMRLKFLELCGKRKKEIQKAVISVIVVLGLACAMGERPAMPPREKLDPDYTYLIGNSEPVFRIYTPRRVAKPRTPTIEIIED
jgi:hypothetical protein